MTRFDEEIEHILKVAGCVPEVLCCPQCKKVTDFSKDNQTLGMSDEVKSIRIKHCRCGYEFTQDEIMNSKLNLCKCGIPNCSCNKVYLKVNNYGEEDELQGL